MTKKLLYIVLGGIFIFGVLFLLWSWLFSGGGNKNQTNGQFGTSTDSTQNLGGGGGVSDNGQTNLEQASDGQNASNGVISLGSGGQNGAGGNSTAGGNSVGSNSASGNGSNSSNSSNGNSTSTTTFNTSTGGGATLGSAGNTSGALWLGSPFNPADINGLSSGAGGFAPTITSSVGGSGSKGLSLVETLGLTAIAGSLSCAIQAGIIVISSSGLAGSVPAGAGSIVLSATGVPVSDLGLHAAASASYALQASTVARNAAKDNVTFLGCIVNVIAKTALQQITSSVVNWINTGFKGNPSFVTNYQQFFANTADLAAGQFIQGAGLAFLCSPFKLQIKIAVAQAYANRGAQSCSLSKVINNINSFMNGNFAQGGWPGMLSFTTMPTNNPYGAYAYAQIGLVGAQSSALANAKNNISPTGFLNLTQQKCPGIAPTASLIPTSGSNSQAASQQCNPGCTCSVVTPGGAIADSLGAVSKSGVDQLGLANDIDQIINALTTQLMVRVLQNGLTSLSQTTTQTPADLAAQSQALTLLNDMQSKSTLAQQLGTIYQGSISDIENAQAGLNQLAGCWGSVASSSDTTPAQNAAAANASLSSLGAQVTSFNNQITQINSTIATLNQFESQISMASSVSDVANVTAGYNTAVAAGTFPSATDLTTAQQNRTTLQSQMATINASTQAGLQQCQAFGH